MPGAWSESARRSFYEKRFGAEEGERRYLAWVAKHESAADSEPGVEQELPPIRGGAEKTPKRGQRKPKKPEIVATLATGIAVTDRIAQQAPVIPWQEIDGLSNEEVGALADATADEILNSPQLMRWYVKMTTAGRHGKFFWVVTSIALPRLVLHGVIPDFFGYRRQAEQQAADTSVPMGGGATPGGYRSDGEREVRPDQPPPPATEVFRGPEVQSGPSEVPGSENGPVILGPRRPAQQPVSPAAEV